MRGVPEIQDELERRVEALGYEVVEIRWGGSGRRPLLQIRLDRPGSVPGTGLTVDECATVSRALEPWLDGLEGISEQYTLEVSSPGVDRPLSRPRDFERFRGEKVVVKARGPLEGRGSRLEGELLGWEDKEGGDGSVLLRLAGGEEVSVPMTEIRKAHLVFTWK